MRARFLLTITIIALAARVGFSTDATSSTSPAFVDLQAETILRSTFRAYGNLQGYRHRESITLTQIYRNAPTEKRFATKFLFQRPNRIFLQLPGIILASDGQTFVSYYPRLGQYCATPAHRVLTPQTVQDAIMEDKLDIVLTVLLSDDPEAALRRRFAKITYGGKIDHKGAAVHKLLVESATEKGAVLIDCQTRYFVASRVEPLLPEAKNSTWRLGVDYENVIANPLAGPKSFTVDLPKSAKQVSRISFTRMEHYQFTATTLPTVAMDQASENSPKITPNDLLGKATLVTFWAQPYLPCQVYLPILNSVYAKYAGRGLVVIAVNIDPERRRNDVLDYVKDKKLGFAVLFDPKQELIRALQFIKLPATVLLGGDGKIIEAHQGVSPRAQFELGRMVESVLDGQPTRDKR